MSDETGYIVKPATTATDPTPETAIRLQLIWWQQQCYGQEVDIKRLIAHCAGLENADKVRREHITKLEARVDELEADLDKYKTGAWSNAHEVIKRRVDGVET